MTNTISVFYAQVALASTGKGQLILLLHCLDGPIFFALSTFDTFIFLPQFLSALQTMISGSIIVVAITAISVAMKQRQGILIKATCLCHLIIIFFILFKYIFEDSLTAWQYSFIFSSIIIESQCIIVPLMFVILVIVPVFALLLLLFLMSATSNIS